MSFAGSRVSLRQQRKRTSNGSIAYYYARLADDRSLLRNPALRGMVGDPQAEELGGGLFPRREEPRVVGDRGVDLRVEYRLGAYRRLGRLGRHQRRRDGALRTSRMVPAGAGLGVRTVLHALHGFHHAGVPRAAL